MTPIAQLGRVAVVASSLFMLSACQPIDSALDCQTICTRYKDCYDGSYDVGACAERCRSQAKANTDFSRSVNICEACMRDRACVEATFSCGSDCLHVVP